MRPRSLSRGVRVMVERGSIEYSPVTQPRPEFRSQPGTPCSTVAQTRTRVLPRETSTEPSAVWTNPVERERGRSWDSDRPPGRKNGVFAGIEGIVRLAGGRSRAGSKMGTEESRTEAVI